MSDAKAPGGLERGWAMPFEATMENPRTAIGLAWPAPSRWFDHQAPVRTPAQQFQVQAATP